MGKKKKAKPTGGNQVDPALIFGNAEYWRRASTLLSTAIPLATDYIFPSLTMSAFSLELYLKCLLHLTGKPGISGHRLKTDLYDKLGGKLQQRLLQHHAILDPLVFVLKNAPEVQDRRLEKILDNANSMFVELRYWHESPASASAEVICMQERLRLVARAVFNLILELQPDWKQGVRPTLFVTHVHGDTPNGPKQYGIIRTS